MIGLTGAPGVGKSTTTAALVGALRAQGQRVAVLAVDPSSPFSGGALLGDRVRMQAHALDPGVYIRSMATRGHLGGLAVAAPQALRVLDAAGFDTVLLETVGVGQSEIEVADQADTTLVLLAPGHGRRGAGGQGRHPGDRRHLRGEQERPGRRAGADPRARGTWSPWASGEPDAWKPPIVATVAHRGEGIAELLDRIEQFRAAQQANGAWTARRVARARREVEGLVAGPAAGRAGPGRGGRVWTSWPRRSARASWTRTPRRISSSGAVTAARAGLGVADRSPARRVR